MFKQTMRSYFWKKKGTVSKWKIYTYIKCYWLLLGSAGMGVFREGCVLVCFKFTYFFHERKR